MKKIIPLFALLLLAGCSTGSHTITGRARQAISSEMVSFYTEKPAEGEVIGVVSASNIWICKQPGTDSVNKELRRQSALMGANGIVLLNQHNSRWDGAAADGTAFYLQLK